MAWLSRKMASWTIVSQFFLIALISLNAYSSPAKKGWNQSNLGSSDMEVNSGLQSATSQGFKPTSSVSWVMARPKQIVFPVQPSNTQSTAVLWATKPPPIIPPPPSSPEGLAVSVVESTNQVPPPLDPPFPPVSWVTLPPRRVIPPSPQNLAIPWVTDSPKILTASPPKPELKLPASPSTQKPPVSWIGYPPKKFSPSISKEPAVPQVAAPLKKLPALLSNPWVVDLPEKVSPASPPSPPGPALSWLVSTYNPQVHPSVDLINEEPTEGSSAHSESSHQFPHAFHIEGHDETENLHSGLPHHTYPGPMFQGGQMNNFASLFEHGISEGEAEDDFVPVYPYDDAELTDPFISMGGMLPPSAYTGPVAPNLFYYFLTGQLPHGTVSHTQMDYEAGGDHRTDFGYEDDHPSDNLPQIQVPTEQL
ncbi:proline-rich receptor-like protein kinase PERK14 [Nematolebias whitei]|uniref:proline-rich receptor-like protein kinase PERK14 n=1 Tax=Nematolebias whitei TaxID=451745 RepID=UPI0018971256|nr:proline-rich receptor-like protein kinase PERK14 [Nematolebias whitei]